ncbi:hypothetical protein JCM3770_004886 [Rhodotorula araucariae]
MDLVGLGFPGRMTPGSARKISHSEYLHAIAAADTPLRESTGATLNHGQHSADPTDANVQAVLSERKRRVIASAVRKEHTPGGLLRALSRLPDLPPPTPDEAQCDPSASASSSIDRRASYVPRHSSLAPVPELSSPALNHFAPPTLDYQSALTGDGEDLTISHDTSNTSSAADVSALLLSTQRLSRAFSHSRRSVPLLSPPPVDLLQLRAITRRDSLVSVASVEQGRRAAPLAEDLTRYFVRRGPRKSELARGADQADEGDALGYSFAVPTGRFSTGSKLPHLASPTHSHSASRLSHVSGFGDLSAAHLSLPVSLAAGDDEGTPTGLEELDEEGDADGRHLFEPAFGPRFNDEDALSPGGYGDELGEGEDRALDWPDLGAVDDVFDWAEAGFENRYTSEAPLAVPQPLPLARIAQNRQKRQQLGASVATKKKKQQRYTRTGEAVPDLPRAKQKALFQQFLGDGVRLDEGAVDGLRDASQDFFASLVDDASEVARRAGRTSLVDGGDIVEVMHSHRLLSSKVPLSSLARQLGVDRELQSVVDGITLGLVAGGTGKRPRRAKKRAKDQSEASEDGTEGE